VLPPAATASIGVDRFLAEIRTTSQLKHPHILPLFDSGSSDSVLFYVMPFIEGESLRARINRIERLALDEVVHILQQLADAMAYAHGRGIIHRDVKLENVLISGCHVFLADFGIARALEAPAAAPTFTATGSAVGTPAYMAPEQAVGTTVDHRADIYALGCWRTSCWAGHRRSRDRLRRSRQRASRDRRTRLRGIERTRRRRWLRW
jgi:serine/threonine-protein kinase